MPVILVDMDYFYAACEEQRHPELKGKPLIVGNVPKNEKIRGVVQTCNYEARKFGIHSGMPLLDAFKLCPAQYVEADEDYYESVSSKVMELVKGYGFSTEVMSIDEAAIDLGTLTYEEALEYGKKIKADILSNFGLPCTVGISSTKYYAKMACDSAKPNGLLIVKDDELLKFISSKEVDKLPGIGKKTAEKLKEMGISTVGQLAALDPTLIMSKFGSYGLDMYLMAIGKDQSKVVSENTVLSIGREHTLKNKTSDINTIEKELNGIAEEVSTEVEKKGYWFRGVSLKVRYEDFSEHIKNMSFGSNESSASIIYKSAAKMARSLMKEGKKVRKLGIRVFNLVPKKGQRSLF
ncbi:MAG: DNA polymerase IV [Candidatus Micrarchaeia archaeon]